MNTRPIATAEENKKLVHEWAHQMRRELPKEHPAQETLTAVIRHNYMPSFPVAKPLDAAKESANRDTSALIYFGLGAIGLVSSGTLFKTHPLWAATLVVTGLIAQCIAFARAQPE